MLEADVKDLREMTPQEQRFAARNKHYLEAVGVHKLCKQYASLRRNNFDPNRRNNLWFWALKQRYEAHKKWPVMPKAYAMCDPTRHWDPAHPARLAADDAAISELLRDNTSDLYESLLLALKEQQRAQTQLAEQSDEEDDADDDSAARRKAKAKAAAAKQPVSQIERDRIHFESVFPAKVEAARAFSSVSTGAALQQQALARKLAKVQSEMDKLVEAALARRKCRPGSQRRSIGSARSRHHVLQFGGNDLGVGGGMARSTSNFSQHSVRSQMSSRLGMRRRDSLASQTGGVRVNELAGGSAPRATSTRAMRSSRSTAAATAASSRPRATCARCVWTDRPSKLKNNGTGVKADIKGNDAGELSKHDILVALEHVSVCVHMLVFIYLFPLSWNPDDDDGFR